MAQSEFGRVTLFDDFLGPERITGETAASSAVGAFRIVGEGIATSGAGIGALVLETDGLSGVVRLGTDVSEKDTTAFVTGTCFNVALMAPIVIEARVQFGDDLDDKKVFIGLTNENGDTVRVEEEIIDATGSTTIENTATNICGFFMSDELSAAAAWHSVYKSGTATAVTDTTELNLNDDAAQGEFQILRLEVDPNGDARWYIDGVLLKSVSGAVSTTTDMAVFCGVGTNAGSKSYFDVDYLLVRANRDWTI